MLDNTDAKYAYSSASTSPPSSSSEGDHQGAGGVAGAGAGAVGAATLQQHMMTAGLDGATPHESTSSSGTVYSVEYLSQLLKDKKQLAAFPNVFHHLDRLADEEINRVRSALFQFEFTGKGDDVKLPDAEGEVTITTEKVFVPAKEHPDFNFVGRILGPRGMTAKQLEQETGCKIMVRGRGSMRDKKKEEANRGKPNWEHLSEELHVLIQCEDTPNRTQVKLARAVEEVRKLLVPAPEGEDELKRKQLMELAIINGTYRSASQQAAAAQLAAAAAGKPMAAALQAAAAAAQAQRSAMLGGAGLRASPGLAGAPIIMSPTGRSQAAAQQAALLGLQGGGLAAAQQAALMQQQQAAAEYQQLLMSQGLSYEQLQAVQYQQQQQQQLNLALLQQQQMGGGGMSVASGGYDYSELAAAQQHAAAGAMLANQRRALGGQRDHPYKQ